jgi:hypothetical protein
MDSRDFVDHIKIAVRDAAISDAVGVLERPPGRHPPAEMVARAQWYASLNSQQRELLAGVIADSVNRAVFGFLCVLDGVRAMEDGEEKGRLELLHIKERSTVLNSPDGPMLHDLF